MKKLINLITVLSFNTFILNVVVSCNKTKETEEKKVINLKKVILNTNIGEIEKNNVEIILNALISKNKELKKESIIVKDITEKSAIITSNGDGVYCGNVKVFFLLKNEGVEKSEKVLVGYYYDWGGIGQVKPSFEEISKTNYNVIDFSFLYSRTAYEMPVYQPINIKETKEGIELLHLKNKKAVISMGGATGEAMRFKKEQKSELKETILNVVNEYGFDGIDIDWEGSCLLDRESQQTTIDVLKEIKDERPNFIITMAPEMSYLKNSTENSGGSYIPFLKGLDKYYDWINPQFYNGWAFGPTPEVDDQKRLGIPDGYITNDDLKYRAEFYYLMTKYLTTKYSPKNDFYLIDRNRFVMGVSTNEAAGRGSATEDAIKKSYKLLSEDGIFTRGLMTWAVNFDAYEGSFNYEGKVISWKKWRFESWYNETHGLEKNK